MAACAKHVTKTSPELFGTLTSVAELQAKGVKLSSELQRLYDAIMVSWVASDFEMEVTSRLGDRRVCLAVKGTNHAVTLTKDLAVHLTDFVLRESASKAA